MVVNSAIKFVRFVPTGTETEIFVSTIVPETDGVIRLKEVISFPIVLIPRAVDIPIEPKTPLPEFKSNGDFFALKHPKSRKEINSVIKIFLIVLIIITDNTE